MPITLFPVPSEMEVYKSRGLASLEDRQVVHSGLRDLATSGRRGVFSR